VKTVAIIATRDRVSLLRRAIASIGAQTVLPDNIIIVGEKSEDFPSEKIEIEERINANFLWLINSRTRCLSGALNTAIIHLIQMGIDPSNHYLAFLDDDDTWDPGYLRECICAVKQRNRDVIVTGIIRHEQNWSEGLRLSIPEKLDQNDFLLGNPNVQGSNLFVRMSSVLRAGCFDENLPSTTDRDLMIRILDLGNINWEIIPHYLVHHYADDRLRLSTYGSKAKLEGLRRFWEKYKNRMSDDQIIKFKERAERLFGWRENHLDLFNSKVCTTSIPISHNKHVYSLVVGFTATHLGCTEALLDDLQDFSSGLSSPMSLVILDNTPERQALEQILLNYSAVFPDLHLVTREEISRDADEGKLGSFYVDIDRRVGVSYGRTALHRYLYIKGLEKRNPIFWILDDDVRLNPLLYGSSASKVSPLEFEGYLNWLIDNKIAILVGGVWGDPPLPVASSIRVQLLELYTAIRETKLDSADSHREEGFHYKPASCLFPEAYYDLSVDRYDHLETPLRLWRESQGDIVTKEQVNSIKQGKNRLRPALPHSPLICSLPVRGGNTIVTDPECLRLYPNCSPRVNDQELRRGDTLWVAYNMYVGGEMVGLEEKRVEKGALFVKHERAPNQQQELLNGTFSADLIGSAFTYALTDLLRKKNFDGLPIIPKNNFREYLNFSEQEIDRVSSLTRDRLDQRTSLIRLNSWRIRGLADSIRVYLKELEGTIGGKRLGSSADFEEIYSLCEWVSAQFSEEKVSLFTNNLWTGIEEGLQKYMEGFSYSRELYARNLTRVANDEQKTRAKTMITNHFGLKSIQLIGSGQEGLVYSDGHHAFKYFLAGVNHFGPGMLEFLKEKLASNKGLKHIASLENILIKGNELVTISRFIEGSEYHVGYLRDLIELLSECKQNGIALTNLGPSNLRVGPQGLVYVDIGRSVVPYSDQLFREMCKRAYITYRWHFHPDLKKILTQSLSDENIPELFGLNWFLNAIEEKDVHNQMNQLLIETCLKDGGKKIFDYGCGTGSVADELARRGASVSCFDIDLTRFKERKHENLVECVEREDLNRLLKSGETFDVALCNLVLCVVEDKTEIKKIFRNLRQLVGSSGRVVVGICSPFFLGSGSTPSQYLYDVDESRYNEHFRFMLKVKTTGRVREEWHRPLDWYIHVARCADLELREAIEVPSIDIDALSPGSDQLILIFDPLKPLENSPRVSLMIKASAMEWRTVLMQVRHIVRQLEGPQSFIEKVLVTDDQVDGFSRQYSNADLEKFIDELKKLKSEGIIDRIIFSPRTEHEIRGTYDRWFGKRTLDPRAANGQPLFMTLYGFDQCVGDYVLQLDDDCLIRRTSRDHDYLGEMVSVLQNDPLAITVSLPIPYGRAKEYKYEKDGKPYRTEVRCCLLDKRRLESILPLENVICEGKLTLPWHRSLDKMNEKGLGRSYRGGDPRTCFIHLQNARKMDINGWCNIMYSIENGSLPLAQIDQPELVGETSEWVGRRNEEVVVLLRGKNVKLSKVRRCLESLETQNYKDWGAIIVDAGSSNGTKDYLTYLVKMRLKDKLTIISNWESITPIENIDFAIRKVCSNPESIIVHLDLDDALIGPKTLNNVLEAYQNGADVSVGSMLRTDKFAEYPVDFDDPRSKRGGNIWQHLRTFKKRLYDEVPEDYLKIDGEWIPHTEDWAFMLPIVELSTKPTWIKEAIYFYEPSSSKQRISESERETMVKKIVSKSRLRRDSNGKTIN
jgi:SAM-dependent methyltransferase/glycosyltransferase involved in cell wall biosynthesis